MAASDLERGRIAADLHDGAVQNLAGVSYSLSAAAGDLQRGDTDGAVDAIEEAARETRRSIRDLRTLLAASIPANLHRVGLAAALGDLVAAPRAPRRAPPSRRAGGPGLPPEAEPFFRAAQEACATLSSTPARSARRSPSAAVDGVAGASRWLDDGARLRPGPGGAGRVTSVSGCSTTSSREARRLASPVHSAPGAGSAPVLSRCRPLTRVLIVDDHSDRPAPAWSGLLSTHDDVEVVGTAGEGE